MIELLMSLPSWFIMIMIALFTITLIATGIAFVYRFVKYGADVKIGPVEIDATVEESHEKD